MKLTKPRLVSLFSGCGGMDKGFELAGFWRVFANDFDKDAQAVFRSRTRKKWRVVDEG